MNFWNYLIKPASSLCNMRCRYCFYEDESENRCEKIKGVMTNEISEVLIGQALSCVDRSSGINFVFQGGEPTAAGLPFFQHFVEQVKAKNTAGIPVQYAIQTNGLVLDDEWIRLFKQNRFLVGVSIDGDKALHDENRIDAAGKGTWNRVRQNYARLVSAGVDVNLLCVVTRNCAHRPQKTYNALKKLGGEYLQFIACLDPLGKERGSMPWSLTPDDYKDFLCGLFDAWYLDYKAGRYVSIRLFDDFIHLAMGLPAGTCSTSGNCGAYLVVEGDGSVYPCDFYALDEWCLGNVLTDRLEDMGKGPAETRFLNDGLDRPPDCGPCRWRPLCNGGCKRDWYVEDGVKKNYFCGAFRGFFAYAGTRIAEIARSESLYYARHS